MGRRREDGWPQPRYWALVEHWDGTAWTRTRAPVRGELRGVSALAADDAWAVGGDYTNYLEGDSLPVLLHWDGEAWRKVDTGSAVHLGPLTDVIALAQDDEWVVGDDADDRAVAAHWDGTRWRSYRLPGSVYASDAVALSSNDVWVAGSAGTEFMALMAPRLWHWNGGKWSPVPAGESEAEGGIHGIAARGTVRPGCRESNRSSALADDTPSPHAACGARPPRYSQLQPRPRRDASTHSHTPAP